MQREIKFRCWDRKDWDVKGKRMLMPGDFQVIDWSKAKHDYDYDLLERYISANGRVIEYTPGHGICEPTISPGGNRYILMQYTGLLDKQGKEIYEGDIVTTGEGYGGFPPYDQTRPRLIEFRNGCWCFSADRFDDGDWIRFGFWTHSNEETNQLKQMEVIGNIWENKELLNDS